MNDLFNYKDLPPNAKKCYRLIFAVYCGAERTVERLLEQNTPCQEALEIALLAAFRQRNEPIAGRLLQHCELRLTEEVLNKVGQVLGEQKSPPQLDSATENCVVILLNSQDALSEKIRICRALAANSSSPLKVFLAQFIANQI